MAPKKPKEGDPILWYGDTLTILDVGETDDGRAAVEIGDPEAREARDRAQARVRELRERQVELTEEAREKIADAESEADASDLKSVGKRAARQAIREMEEEHAEIAEEIEALSEAAESAVFGFRIRADLMDWWGAREIWVSDGRILSDDQAERFADLTGNPPKPDKQRGALQFLEAQEGA